MTVWKLGLWGAAVATLALWEARRRTRLTFTAQAEMGQLSCTTQFSSRPVIGGLVSLPRQSACVRAPLVKVNATFHA